MIKIEIKTLETPGCASRGRLIRRIQRSAALARRIRTLTDGVGRRADRRVAESGTAAPGVGRPDPGPPGHPDP